jgi:protoheme IX farnesyltransferase
MSATIGNYWRITKPGIIAGNLISVTGGFLLASKGNVKTDLLLLTIAGVSLVIASGCVVNNCADKNLDRLMARTCHRALARGLVPRYAALLYAAILGAAGVALLWTTKNLLTLSIVLAGFIIYAGIYTLYLKRQSVYAALIGSLAGAAPPLAGYCAASNRFDSGALILLFIFSLWQMPHFYSIAIFRLEDYAAAAIPVVPLKLGIFATKKHIMGYILAFTVATLLLTVMGYTGYHYFMVALALCVVWLFLAWAGFKASDDRLWAKKLFTYSIVTIFVLSMMMSIDCVRPPAANPPQHFVSQSVVPASFPSP